MTTDDVKRLNIFKNRRYVMYEIEVGKFPRKMAAFTDN